MKKTQSAPPMLPGMPRPSFGGVQLTPMEMGNPSTDTLGLFEEPNETGYTQFEIDDWYVAFSKRESGK